RDVIIPHAAITSYLEACSHARSLTYRVIEGADHGLSDHNSQQAYTALLQSWLTEMVFGPHGKNLSIPLPSATPLPHDPERPD
ncbi:MAG: alpha/beta hydrolase, partial [Janthinobacterium lividum]